MEATDARGDTVTSVDEFDEPRTTITAHRSSPDRVVFTEENNTDGWIATDLTVDLER